MPRATDGLPAEHPEGGDLPGRALPLALAAVLPVATGVVLYAVLAAAGVAPWRALPALLAALAAYALLWSVRRRLRLRRSGAAPACTKDRGPTTPGSS